MSIKLFIEGGKRHCGIVLTKKDSEWIRCARNARHTPADLTVRSALICRASLQKFSRSAQFWWHIHHELSCK